MSTVTDVLRIGFYGAAVFMTVQMMAKIGNQTRMTIVDLPMNIVYGLCLLGFAAMLVREQARIERALRDKATGRAKAVAARRPARGATAVER